MSLNRLKLLHSFQMKYVHLQIDLIIPYYSNVAQLSKIADI